LDFSDLHREALRNVAQCLRCRGVRQPRPSNKRCIAKTRALRALAQTATLTAQRDVDCVLESAMDA
jgi:hypothetical protein